MSTPTIWRAVAALAAVFACASDAGAAGRPCEPAHIVGGSSGYCALRNDGRVACWGDELYFRPYSPAPQGRFRQVSVSPYSACGVREDGSGVCWGKGVIQDIPQIDGDVDRLAVGLHGVEAIRPNGTIDFIPIGNNAEEPVPAGTFAQVSDGCDLRTDGTIDCNGTATPPDGEFESVAGLCGVAAGGALKCWGQWESFDDTTTGSLYRNVSSSSSFSPVDTDEGICAVTLDGQAVCRSEDGEVSGAPDENFREVAFGFAVPWGLTTDGRLVPWSGWANVGDEFIGVSSPVVGTFTQIAAGGDGGGPLSCGVQPSGHIVCWGNDRYGQASPPAGNFVEVGVGPYHGCGRRTDGTIACWGEDSLKDTQAPSGQFQQISLGYFGPNCALRTNGAVACWGYGDTALDVPAGTFASIAAGAERACALTAGGAATCWRYVEGNSPTDIKKENVAVPAGTYAEIQPYFHANATIRDSHFCGRTTSGTVTCWTDENGVTPWTPPAGKFVKLSKGGGFACGIRSTGNIECWGPDWIAGYLTPPEGEFVEATAGAGFVCGRTDQGDVVCNGDDQTVSLCAPSELCGNGDLDDSETCDDGNSSYAPGDECTAGCWSVPCGQPVHPDADGPLASDALFTLRAAVGSSSCSAAVCDVDSSSSVTAVDALVVLRRSVGTGASLSCS